MNGLIKKEIICRGGGEQNLNCRSPERTYRFEFKKESKKGFRLGRSSPGSITMESSERRKRANVRNRDDGLLEGGGVTPKGLL